MMEKNILNIYCPKCGAPAQFDIIHQVYACQYCGGKVTLESARNEKKEISRHIDQKNLRNYKMEMTSCPGCGARIVFEENEALSNCEFCGRSLVRKQYTGQSEIPRYVIPFGITLEEAKDKLTDWCRKNSGKQEAKHLQAKISELKGYYLPYEMVRGPVRCAVSKRSEDLKFNAEGYLNDEFVNCSGQLDNLVLDSMEPFDFDKLQEFDFAYVAGHRVKIADINEKEISKRLHDEAEANYRVHFEKMWGTRAINTETVVEEVIRFPVLLPTYYIADGNTKAAVNGQTGKVSVSAEKQGSYLALPWWLKGITVLLLSLGATFGVLNLSAYSMAECLYITGVLGIFYFFIFFFLLQFAGSTEFGIFHYRKIFNSGEQTYRREQGRLVLNDAVLRRRIAEPIFREKLDGRKRAVSYSFFSFRRMALMFTLSIMTVFLPVIIALFVNGFDFTRLDLGGSCVWFCITVPLTPIVLIIYGFQLLYENPWIYVFTEDGKLRRYRKKIDKKKVMEGARFVLRILIVPPACLASWFAILSFIVTIYLTAFGG